MKVSEEMNLLWYQKMERPVIPRSQYWPVIAERAESIAFDQRMSMRDTNHQTGNLGSSISLKWARGQFAWRTYFPQRRTKGDIHNSVYQTKEQ